MRYGFQQQRQTPAARCRLAAPVAMALLLPVLLWSSSASAAKVVPSHAAAKLAPATGSLDGCHDGWRRVGTTEDPVLRREWAVVVSCSHPAWPAHLEPADQWRGMAAWVPAGSRVVLSSAPGHRQEVTAMHLIGKTLTPGRVGQGVTVRLIDGARVKAKLTSSGSAVITTAARWRQP